MIVLDCSILIASLLPDEQNFLANTLFDELAHSREYGIVPSLFYLECTNVIAQAKRKKRLSSANAVDYLNTLFKLPLEVDTETTRPQYIQTIFALSEKYQLSSYDAAYLELAKRKAISLATLDKKLGDAAARENCLYS